MTALLATEEKILANDNSSTEKKILFVCSGNTCRSPMAEAIFNSLYSDKGYKAFSRGLVAFGDSISPFAIRALENMGIQSDSENNYQSHISKNISEDDIEKANEVITMTNDQLMTLIFSYPSFSSKFSLLKNEIPDPYGHGQETYNNCAEILQSMIKEKFDGIIK